MSRNREQWLIIFHIDRSSLNSSAVILSKESCLCNLLCRKSRKNEIRFICLNYDIIISIINICVLWLEITSILYSIWTILIIYKILLEKVTTHYNLDFWPPCITNNTCKSRKIWIFTFLWITKCLQELSLCQIEWETDAIPNILVVS